ncbi:MAG: ATP-binding protein [Chloroflexi bacterium]|nr:ATP-binding protein [Chloroflexota bacterium]
MKRVFQNLFNSLALFYHSIRFRLTLWFVLILAFVLAAFSAFIYFAQARDLQIDEVGQMQEKFARVTAFFRNPDWQNLTLSATNVPGSNAPLQSGDLMILTDMNGQTIQSWGVSPSNPNTLISELVSAASQRHDLNVYEQSISYTNNGQQSRGDYLFIITPVLGGDHLLGFLIVGSPSSLNNQLRRLMLSLLLGSLGMLAVAFLGGLWLADRAMRPVKAITRTAHTISESDLSRRINLRGRDELAQLAGTFDEMLARLQSAFDRQRRFVADASHELRTPLTIINLEVGRVLSNRHSADEYKKALQTVDAEGARMSRLVNDLMTLARMDSGQAILQMEDIDLSDAAVEAVERMSPLAEHQNVKLEVGEMPELHVRGDRQSLIQMISNLIENGIKYSGAGQTVKIETDSHRNGKHDFAVLRVTDTGPGIPSDHLPRLFDRFYRVDQARARDTDEDSNSPTGSGLGLSIVASIVQMHGGEIHVESKVNKGTTFEVTLPLQSEML